MYWNLKIAGKVRKRVSSLFVTVVCQYFWFPAVIRYKKIIPSSLQFVTVFFYSVEFGCLKLILIVVRPFMFLIKLINFLWYGFLSRILFCIQMKQIRVKFDLYLSVEPTRFCCLVTNCFKSFYGIEIESSKNLLE